MLKRLNSRIDEKGASINIVEAKFPAPFKSGLEYGSPARGTWNIVHTGMLIPESHQIFVCASNCIRGVVLTAAEMGLSHRFSTITIKENNVLVGDMEELIIEGVTDILNKLPKMPRAILVYTSCIHHFIGCDLELCYNELRKRFPNVDFTDCYMNPIMRKSGWTPDQLMRRQLYSLLRPMTTKEKRINIVGNNFPTKESSDLVKMIKANGFEVIDINDCKTYDEYLKMAEASINISYNSAAKPGAEIISKKLGQQHLYLPFCYGKDEIRKNMKTLSDILGIEYQIDKELEAKAEMALQKAKNIIGDTPIAIDYSVTLKPMGLARLLVEHGFNVEKIYIDSINGEEKDDFIWLQENAPYIMLFATVHSKMRLLPRKSDEKVLAIGQKAAYFLGTNYFVNIVEGDGLYGFDGIAKLAKLMEEAFLEEKDARNLIQIKGLGCGCC